MIRFKSKKSCDSISITKNCLLQVYVVHPVPQLTGLATKKEADIAKTRPMAMAESVWLTGITSTQLRQPFGQHQSHLKLYTIYQGRRHRSRSRVAVCRFDLFAVLIAYAGHL